MSNDDNNNSSIVVVLTRAIPVKAKTPSCSVCGSTKTKMTHRILRDGIIIKYPNWSKGMCMNCYSRYVINPIHNRSRIRFKEKHILLKQSPRIGVCNTCRAVVLFDCPKTHMNHFIYDEQNPLNHTLEQCMSCHSRYHHSRQQLYA